MRNFKEEIISNNKFGNKKIAVITGTSSGLGKQTAKALLNTGEWHVIGGCRDLDKMSEVALQEEFNLDDFTPMKLDLASFRSVNDFVNNLNEFKSGRPIDRLVCNAAVYQPTLNFAKYTEDGIEQQLQINHLSHFLLCSLMVSSTHPIILRLAHCAIDS